MKKLNYLIAAVTACLGTISLGSCSQNEMAYQGEDKDASKLRVTTRTEGEPTPPDEGIVYVFGNEGKCTNIMSAEDLKNHNAISALPGNYKLIAIGSNDMSIYNLPNQENATDSSIIELKTGKTINDLQLKTDSATLTEGTTTQINMVLNREVICTKNITIEKVPTDVIKTELTIAPIYKNIRLNGEYTDESDTLRIPLTEDKEEGKWVYDGDSILSLPTKNNPTISVITTSENVIKEYSIPTTTAIKKNYYAKYEIVYNEGIKTYLSSRLTSPEWEGTDTVKIEFGEGNIIKIDSIKTEGQKSNKKPVAGDAYLGYYVVSVGEGKAVLLRRAQEKGFTSAEQIAAKAAEINKPAGATCGDWRIPTAGECKAFLSDEKVNLVQYKEWYYCMDGESLKKIKATKSNNGVITIDGPYDTEYNAGVYYRPVIDIKY